MVKKKRQGLVIKEDKADAQPRKAKGKKAVKGAAEADGTAPPPSPAPWLHDYSTAELEAAVSWLLWPMTPEDFFREYWEKKPLHLKRNSAQYYEGLFSKRDLDQEVKQGKVRYVEQLNLVQFQDGKKMDLNKGPGIASSKDVEQAWKAGATLQVLHPQQFHPPVRSTMAALERSFGALFGANAYVTPAGQQGLAPHYDDVEVFMLQLEGSKRWRLHQPPADEEYPLPRTASRDFREEELGELLLECLLQPGDLLYFPRGTVHAGVAEGAAYSNHLTVSTYQGISWHSFLEKALAGALEKAAGEDPEFRQGLPLNFSHVMGTWFELGGSSASSARDSFRRRAKDLLQRLQNFVELDEACDEMAVDFMTQRLPPRPLQEKSESPSISADTKVKWLDPSAVRPMLSTDPETSEATVLLFHSTSNDSQRHMCNAEAEEVGCLRYEASTFLPALRALHAAGTDAVRCGDLPLDESDAIALCENLLEAGCLELAT